MVHKYFLKQLPKITFMFSKTNFWTPEFLIIGFLSVYLVRTCFFLIQKYYFIIILKLFQKIIIKPVKYFLENNLYFRLAPSFHKIGIKK